MATVPCPWNVLSRYEEDLLRDTMMVKIVDVLGEQVVLFVAIPPAARRATAVVHRDARADYGSLTRDRGAITQ